MDLFSNLDVTRRRAGSRVAVKLETSLLEIEAEAVEQRSRPCPGSVTSDS
jgi:hypothetical protein